MLCPSEANYTLREVYEDICGRHIGGRSLAYKILRQGFYWPSIMNDAISFVQKYDWCQRFAKVQTKPSMLITQILVLWPFDMWSIDILDPLPMATGQRKFLLIIIHYFTKWVEAEPGPYNGEKDLGFCLEIIIYRFGLPRYIISDNRK